ncbi:MAG: sulfate ABC transporter substrate-binding protein [Lachnospiraceae bacterium]|nr:sulfate ABC transporter substrate-binding protein [Lachnospiraceae bacterium]
MKSRFLTAGLTLTLVLGTLTGCGSSASAAASEGASGSSAAVSEGASGSSVSAAASGEASGSASLEGTTVELTNVSYDPTRELYAAYNELFADYWQEQKGQTVEITQSHGGSGKQALEVANGLEADVVTLALEGDVDAVKNAGLIEEGYTSEFDLDSSPYTSTIVFLVRKDNPKNIQDWDDLTREDVGVITPNPKTSGGARWNYLAAWYYFEKQGLSEDQIKEQLKALFQNVVVLDSGARGSTTSFVENGQGDVLIAWENEAFLSLEENPDDYEIVVPSVSILCQPTVAVVDEVVDKRGTREVAEEYLSYLYSDDAQKLEAEWYYRPTNENILSDYEYAETSNTITEIPEDGKWIITNVELTDISHFNGWTEATEKHFADGGVFDEIYEE